MRNLFIFTLLFFITCTKKAKIENIDVAALPDVLAFVTFKISAEKDKRIVTVLDITKTTGKPKSINEEQNHSDKTLKIVVKHGYTIKEEIILEHPLYKSVEYPDGDSFKRKEINLTEETFFIRTVIKENHTTIDFIEIMKGKNSMITTIKL